MISSNHIQSPMKNNIPTNTILYDLTCLMEELGKHEHILNEKIDEKYLSSQEIEDEDNQYISFEEDKIFDNLFSKASYYDDFVQYQTRPNKQKDKQLIQKSKKSLVQNDSQRRIIQMAQYFLDIRNSFQSHKSKFKSTIQLYQDTISQRQDITFQIDHKQTLINQLSDLYKQNQKTLQKTNQSLQIQCKQLERQISNEMIQENKVRIKYQLSKLIFNDNQLIDTLEEIEGLDDNQFEQSQELVEIFNEAMSLVGKLKEQFNIQREKKNINDYLSLLKSKNAQLQQDSKKVQDLLTSGLQFTESINSQNSSVQELSIQYLFEVHNDPFYKQKQLKIVQEQFNYFENTIKKFVNYLDQIKTDADSVIKIQEAIQNNVSKKESINRINLEITNIQNKLQNSTGEETQSKIKDKAQSEQEIEQSTRTCHQLKKLLELKQQRIQQLQTKINNKKRKRQEKKQRKMQKKKKIAEQSKNKRSESLNNSIMQSSKSKIVDQSKNNSKSKPLSKIRQQQHSDKSVSPQVDKKLSKPRKRSTVMKKK